MKGIDYVNVGTGNGYSVLEMVKAFGDVWGSPVKYKIAPRRPGDIAECYADPSLAKELLGWEAKFDIERMCKDADRWQSMNPNGYID
jgi:UDP-glucose 4-epimerase